MPDEYYRLKAVADSYKTVMQWVLEAIKNETYTKEEIIEIIENELVNNVM